MGFYLSRPIREMKILLIGKHPRTGGAAIASSRLMEALRTRNVDVSMLVQEPVPSPSTPGFFSPTI